MADSVLTYEKLKETMREFESQLVDLELPIFLSDSWAAYKILKNGGIIIHNGDGQYYLMERPKLEFPICDLWR